MASRNSFPSELDSEAFTERRIDTNEEEHLRNISTKSIILAPFNSTKSHISSKLHESVEELIIDKTEHVFLHHRVKEVDWQYEINNNGELDNGVYNKFVNNSIRNDNDGDKANEEMVSHDTEYSGDQTEEDYLMQLGKALGQEGVRNPNEMKSFNI